MSDEKIEIHPIAAVVVELAKDIRAARSLPSAPTAHDVPSDAELIAAATILSGPALAMFVKMEDDLIVPACEGVGARSREKGGN